MKILITGSSGHLGEALMRVLPLEGHEPVGLDIKPGPFTTRLGSIVDRDFVKRSMHQIEAVIHTATLHKPHVATHSGLDFIDTNIVGTLNLLEESVAAGIRAFVFTSTTSVFGLALSPPAGEPASWITEDVMPLPKNIYGVTKLAAENLCEIVNHAHRLPCVILRTSRFFPDADDRKETREAYADANIKVNELLYRRADIEDVASAHVMALEKAREVGFGRFVVSAPTPFTPDDLAELRADAPAVVRRYFPEYEAIYAKRGWSMFPSIDRVCVSQRARTELGWQPQHNFASTLHQLEADKEYSSALAQAVGSKGYHRVKFKDGLYPV
ncbi:MAG: NAD(P)-dependent oxidoreductase [Acidobacteriota bacterium]